MRLRQRRGNEEYTQHELLIALTASIKRSLTYEARNFEKRSSSARSIATRN